MHFGNSVLLHTHSQRIRLQAAILRTKVVAYNSVNYERPIYFARGGEDFAAGEVAPLIARDDSTGLKPLVVGVHIRLQIGAGGCSSSNHSSPARHFNHLLAKPINFQEVG